MPRCNKCKCILEIVKNRVVCPHCEEQKKKSNERHNRR